MTVNRMMPIFVGGTGRSGTTILKKVLSCHSSIVSVPEELRFIVDPGGALELIQALSDNWSPYSADIATHRFKRLLGQLGRSKTRAGIKFEKIERKLFRRLGIAPRAYLGLGIGYYFGHRFYNSQVENLINQIVYKASRGNWLGSPSFPSPSVIYESEPFCKSEIERILERFVSNLYNNIALQGETHWVDDTPTNLLYASSLLNLFPRMKFIHIYRDPRDVLASYKQFYWGGEDVVTTARRIASIYQSWFKLREKLPDHSYIEIGLEELSLNSAKSLKLVCAFLNLPFEEELLAVRLDKVNRGRWKRDLTAEEWQLSEPYLKEVIDLQGYGKIR